MDDIIKRIKQLFKVPTAYAPTKEKAYPKGFPSNTVLFNNHSGTPQMISTPTPTMQNYLPQVKGTQTINPNLQNLTAHIARGLAGTPAATLAAYFAQAGSNLQKKYPKFDPYMPAVLARKETGGGAHMADKNNLLNIQYGGIGNSPYERPEYGIVGGGGKGGFPYVMQQPGYAKYLQTGNLNDFFSTYTPHTNNSGQVINGSYPAQINQYNAIRKDFE